jgi:hypothetical protein
VNLRNRRFPHWEYYGAIAYCGFPVTYVIFTLPMHFEPRIGASSALSRAGACDLDHRAPAGRIVATFLVLSRSTGNKGQPHSKACCLGDADPAGAAGQPRP